MKVSFTPAARRQALAADVWWRTHRMAAPELFADELDASLARIALAPQVGRLYAVAEGLAVRRVLLLATRYHVYYRLEGEIVRILAVWSARRGRPPPI